MTRARRAEQAAVALLVVGALAAAIASESACRPAPDVPCHVDGARVLTEVPAGATLSRAPGEGLVVTSLHTAPALDGGVGDDDAGDAAISDAGTDAASDGGDASVPFVPPQSLPDGARIVLLDGAGAVTRDLSVPAPSALRARRGSTTDVAATWTGQGVLFRWTESTTSTDADGTKRSATRLVAAYVDPTGVESSAREVARCDDCTLVATSAASRDATAIVWVTRAGSADTTSPASSALTPGGNALGFATYAPDGTPTAEGDLPWIAADATTPAAVDAGLAPANARSARVGSTGDLLIVRSATRAWIVDATLRPVAGPVPAPQSAVLAWNGATQDVAVAWSGVGANAPQAADQIGPSTAVGESPDIDLRRYDFTGRPRTDARRLTTGQALGVAGDERRGYGVLSFDGSLYFALGDGAGNKRGGDLALPAEATSSPPTLGGVSSASTSSFTHDLTWDGTRFVDTFPSGTSIVRREIVCDP